MPVRRAVPLVPLFRWIPLFRRVPLFLWVPLVPLLCWLRCSVGFRCSVGSVVPLVSAVPLGSVVSLDSLVSVVLLGSLVPLGSFVSVGSVVHTNRSQPVTTATQHNTKQQKKRGSAAEAVACKSGHRALVAREGPLAKRFLRPPVKLVPLSPNPLPPATPPLPTTPSFSIHKHN